MASLFMGLLSERLRLDQSSIVNCHPTLRIVKEQAIRNLKPGTNSPSVH